MVPERIHAIVGAKRSDLGCATVAGSRVWLVSSTSKGPGRGQRPPKQHIELVFFCLILIWPLVLMADKFARRTKREDAVKQLNVVASAIGVDPIAVRSNMEDVAEHFSALCSEATAEHRDRLLGAASQWVENGGDDLDLTIVPGGEVAEGADMGAESLLFPGGEEPVQGHSRIHKIPGKAFRIRSRAFMLTFNAVAFTATAALFEKFVLWLQGKMQEYGATPKSG